MIGHFLSWVFVHRKRWQMCLTEAQLSSKLMICWSCPLIVCAQHEWLKFSPLAFKGKVSQLEKNTWTIESAHDIYYAHIKSNQFGWTGWEWSFCIWRSELFLSFVTVLPLNPQPERFLFFVEKIISLAYLEYIQSRPRYRNITSVPNPPQQTWLHAKEAWKISEDQGGESGGNSCYASLNS